MVPDVVVVFELDGVEHKLSFQDLPLSWWSDVKAQAGFTPKTLMLALRDADVDGYVALIWLVKRQQRPAVTYGMVYDKLTAAVQLEFKDVIRDGRSLFRDADEALDDGPPAVPVGEEEDDPPTTAGSS
ncbi:MAG: hypothetical protein M3N32_07765 [Actinomycetota bacterium]|nr:hypothetical protein [Actinomycetota bacterium]